MKEVTRVDGVKGYVLEEMEVKYAILCVDTVHPSNPEFVTGHPIYGDRPFWWNDELGRTMVWDSWDEAADYASDWHHDEFTIGRIGGGVYGDRLLLITEAEAQTDYK